MATTTKVIVQIHERTTEVQIDADLQSREIGFISTTNVLRFQENDGTNHNVWMQDSSGVTFDNNVALSAEAYINTRVGINNTNPSSISHADADNVVVGNSSTTNNGLSIISSTLATLAFGDAADDNVGRLTYSHSSNAMAFTTNGTFAVIIDSSQSVGIGNTTPSSESNANADELVVGSNANANSGITIASSTLATIAFGDTADDNIGSITYSHSSNAMSLTTNTVSAVFIDSSQNVGINNITPSSKLDVNGTGRFVGDVDFDGNISITADGNKLLLGGLDECAIYFDGTTGLIIENTDSSGTDDVFINANTGSVYLQTNLGTNVLEAKNSGVDVTGVLDATSITSSGNIDGATLSTGNETFTYNQGTFTMNTTGFTSNPSGTAYYTLVGDVVTMQIPALASASNSTAFTLTGLPAEIRPTSARKIIAIGEGGQDNSTIATAYLDIKTDGTVTVMRYSGTAITALWTNTNNKGLLYQYCFSYNLS